MSSTNTRSIARTHRSAATRGDGPRNDSACWRVSSGWRRRLAVFRASCRRGLNDVDDLAIKEALYIEAYEASARSGDELNQLLTAHSLAELYIDDHRNASKGRVWLTTWSSRSRTRRAGAQFDKDYSRMARALMKLDSSCARSRSSCRGPPDPRTRTIDPAPSHLRTFAPSNPDQGTSSPTALMSASALLCVTGPGFIR
jgi:hypothetical protein